MGEPQHFGRYEVRGKIGQGGMGAVYRAWDPSLRREVAVKTLLPQLAANEAFVRRFEREAALAAQLTSPYAVRVYDVGKQDGVHYIVMAFAGGESLADRLQREKIMTERDACRICADVARALLEAQEYRIVHRDIKPANIMVDDKGAVRLLDLGIAKQLVAAEDDDQSRQLSLTMGVIGTPSYMSPEQADGDALDHRTDVYSLGATLYALVCGEPPYSDTTPQRTMRRVVTDRVPDPRKKNPGLSREVAGVICKMLAKDRADRYQTFAEVVAELDACAAGQRPDATYEHTVTLLGGSGGVPRTESGPGVAAPSSVDTADLRTLETPMSDGGVRRPRRGKAVAVVVACLVLAAAGAYVFYPTRGAPPAPPYGGVTPPKPAVRRPPRATAAEAAAALLGEARALAASEPAAAAAKLNDLIYRYPDTDARREAEKLKAEIDQGVAERRKLDERVAQALRAAAVQEQAGLLSEAVATLGALLPEAPENTKLRDEIARLRKKLAEQTSAADRERSYQQFLDAGLAAEIKGDWESAVKGYQAALENRDTAEARGKLASARHELYLARSAATDDLQERIGLLTQALAAQERPATRQLLVAAQAARKRRDDVAAGRAAFTAWVQQGAASEKAGDWAAARGFYAKAGEFAADLSDAERAPLDDALKRCAAESARLDAARQHAAEQERLATAYRAKVAAAEGSERREEWAPAVVAWTAARTLAAGLDARPAVDFDARIAACETKLGPLIPDALRRAGWKAEKRGVTVATPKGEEKKEIVYFKNSLGMEFVQIPAGEFIMGRPAGEAGRDDDEGPQHKVTLTKAFLLGATEVTNGQYRRFKRDHDSKHYQGNTLNGDDQPVVYVSWDEAAAFCKWLSEKEGVTYRLPTEAEWEHACRAGTTTRFYSGDADSALDAVGWYGSNSGNTTHPVGGRKPNGWGVYDMHGNVWEWCQDWYGNYAAGDATDPTGPATGQWRVLRGGGWYYNPQVCRSAARIGGQPADRGDGGGFRLVVVVSPRPSNP